MNTIDQTALKTKNNLPYFETPEIAKFSWIQHAFLTRRGGVGLPPYDSLNLSDKNGDREEFVSKNKKIIARTFGFDSSRLILLDQMHQDQILLLKKSIATLPSPLEYDALITNFPNIYLGIQTADCIPILVVDQKKKVIAAIHAGRQGTALRITEKALRKMEQGFGSLLKDLLIAVGPSIGPFCYELDEKVFQQEWKPFSSPTGAGKWMVDLARINIDQMKRKGIKEDQISWINLCTHCFGDLFFSYRKEGRTGRQLSFIGILE